MHTAIKQFLAWIGLKEKIHNHEHNPPLFKEGEIWWCYVGENVGSEVNGKGAQFTRPVLIFKKYDRFSFFAIPLTTKNKVGTWYFSFIHNNKTQTAQLAQSRVVSYKRLKELIGKIDSVDFENIKKAFIELHNLKK